VTALGSPWHRGAVTRRPASVRPSRAATSSVVVTAAAALAVGALAGCGGSATPGEVVVTVTASDSGTPDDSGSAASEPDSTSPAPEATVESDDTGRRFDFGVVKAVEAEGDTEVLVFDRWTDPEVDDAVLAKEGLEVTTYDLAKNPYRNVNTTVTFRIPVRDGTSFLLHHCVQAGEPLTSKSVSAAELAAAPASDRLVLLTIDPESGYTTGGESLAGC
jgi:hypothetical protein